MPVDVWLAVFEAVLVLVEDKLTEGVVDGLMPGQTTESTVTRLEQLSESQGLLVTFLKGPPP